MDQSSGDSGAAVTARRANLPPQGTREAVVLVHGIWCGPALMAPLAARLRRCGFQTHRFGYPSVRRSPAKNAALLRDFVAGLNAPVVHFVGHSLGGLVILRLLHDYPHQPPGRIVLLGTPLTGSKAAKRLGRWRLGRRMLGRSTEQGLFGDGPAWDGGRALGMVAGTRSVGLGVLLGASGLPGDGAVLLSETRIAGISDHVCVRTSHSGLLFASAAATQVCAFLRRGQFDRHT